MLCDGVLCRNRNEECSAIPEKSPGFATANFHLKKLEKNPRNQLKNIDTHGRIVKIWAEISMPGSSSEMNT